MVVENPELSAVMSGSFPDQDMHIGQRASPYCRLLVVEDCEERLALLQGWIPEAFRPTFVRSAGRAIAVMQLDAGSAYAGVLLDHDLDQAVANESEFQLNGQQVVRRLIEWLDRESPVLIHSVNPLGARAMERHLIENGFDATRIPFYHLDRERLGQWLEIVQEQWEVRN